MKRITTFAIAALVGVALAGCATVPTAEEEFQAAQSALSLHIQTLSGEDYGGREPGTEGGRKTQQYLVDALQSYGFQPGAVDSEGEPDWRQKVTLVRSVPDQATINFPSGRSIADADVMVRMSGSELSIKDSRITVFAPGAPAPPDGSQNGRVAVVFGDAFFSGDARSLSDAGFDAIIILFEDEAQFERAQGFYRDGRWVLEGDADAAVMPYVLVSPAGSRVFAGGLTQSLESMRSLATGRDNGEWQYRNPLSITASATIERAETANVIGKLPGKVRDSGAVLLLAHWDHLGICGPEGAVDRLCNGAVDNASGIGVMLETARRISKEGGLDRDLYVMGTTAEELGLVGAEVFASDPPFPLPTIVAAFNMDTVAIAPRGSAATVIGWGRTPLDKGISEVIASIGAKLDVKEEHQQFVRRQDGWALLSRDVPAVLVSSSFGDEAAFQAFLGGPYHRPNDEWSPDMELGGATDDIFLHIALLHHFGSVTEYQPGED
ncbi:M28 family peptidase [Parerythrobacter aestuarii]|uniref:M28 family peptidase n=1 Tax=Parerythrobacter aestuarii TaxID=3020909 RepID=UPI0024DE4E71|nr:M28 family peptidase [Parerythrobacter aestuarii]